MFVDVKDLPGERLLPCSLLATKIIVHNFRSSTNNIVRLVLKSKHTTKPELEKKNGMMSRQYADSLGGGSHRNIGYPQWIMLLHLSSRVRLLGV